MWDAGSNGFDYMDEGNVDMLEITNLSLDEPTLKTVIYFFVATKKAETILLSDEWSKVDYI